MGFNARLPRHTWTLVPDVANPAPLFTVLSLCRMVLALVTDDLQTLSNPALTSWLCFFPWVDGRCVGRSSLDHPSPVNTSAVVLGRVLFSNLVDVVKLPGPIQFREPMRISRVISCSLMTKISPRGKCWKAKWILGYASKGSMAPQRGGSCSLWPPVACPSKTQYLLSSAVR